MKKIILIACLLGKASLGFLVAQSEVLGAKSAGLCHVAAAEDGWSLFNCASQTAFLPSQWMFQCEEYGGTVSSLSAAMGFLHFFAGGNSCGAGWLHTAMGDFRRETVVATFAHGLSDRFAMALQCQYLRLSYTDAYYGHLDGFSFALSVTWQPSEAWSWSFLWVNPAGLHYRFSRHEASMASCLRMSARYAWSPSLRCYAECEQNSWFPFRCAVGMEKDLSFVCLRIASVLPQFQFSAGLGMRFGAVVCDAACMYHPDLGPTLALSLQQRLGLSAKTVVP